MPTLAPVATVPESSTPANSPCWLITTLPLWLSTLRALAPRGAKVPTSCRQVPEKPLSTALTVAVACNTFKPLGRPSAVLLQAPVEAWAVTVCASVPSR